MAVKPSRAPILTRGSHIGLLKEQRVLERIAQALPDHHIWSALEVLDPSGNIDEIDFIVLGHYGLYVVDVKHFSGRIAGEQTTWSVKIADGPPRVVDNPLLRLRRSASNVEAFVVQQLGLEAILVEPLILLPDDDVELALPESARRHVVTMSELRVAVQSGELPGDTAPPAQLPVDASTARAIASALGGLRRRVRPGSGNLAQELSLLQHDVVADLAGTVARAADAAVAGAAVGWGDNVRNRIEESAATWVIACAFVRALEERGYIEHPLAGEQLREDARASLSGNSTSTPRGDLMYLLSTIGLHPACESILGRGNRSLWDLMPSDAGAAALLSFLTSGDRQRRDRDRLALASDRMWGDLYQGISVPLRDTNALVQTPSIVEEFLLAQTLDPAIEELGAARVRVLDPACGSGTLLVGAFRRLLARQSPSRDGHLALAVLARVAGVDISPVATMITRIRLVLAYCEATGCAQLSGVPPLPLHVATADSLLPSENDVLESSARSLSPSDVLTSRYPVVVCAPPWISVRDPDRRKAYRERYCSAVGNFPLSNPFIERCFQLADHGGFVGLLVGNSFMKRESGRPLVELVLAKVDLTHVIDTSGAFIPGYGSPTMLLLGRNRAPETETIRVVAGKRSEPISPIHTSQGRVWTSIVRYLSQPGYEDDYVAVSDVRRGQLARHPWVLGARDVMTLRELLEHGGVPLQDLAASVRRGNHSGLDQVFTMPERTAQRLGLEPELLRAFVGGAAIRDFALSTDQVALVPSDHDVHHSVSDRPQWPMHRAQPRWWTWLERYRPVLANRRAFGSAAPVLWWAWLQDPPRSRLGMRIIGPAIANNCYFALATGDLIASRSVVIIELAATASDALLYALLAFLNSSTASFWIKQTALAKTRVTDGQGPEQPVYEFLGALRQLPIPRALLEPGAVRDKVSALAMQLERTATELAAASPEQFIERWSGSTRSALVEALADAQLRERALLRRMVCEQEDLDWVVYEAVGLTNGEGHTLTGSASPEQRPFAWLTNQPPAGLDRRLTESWRRRREAGQAYGPLRVLETAVYKRVFRVTEDDRVIDPDDNRDDLDLDRVSPALGRHDHWDYERRTELACERWLLDRLEELFRDTPPQCVSAHQLASRIGVMTDVPPVASLLTHGRGEVPEALLEKRVVDLLRRHAVPYLAALRHTESGLAKRVSWEASWTLMRQRDAGELVANIPAPQLYDGADYRDALTFQHRGKLDVARERFISYPGQGGVYYGWAGWTAVHQAEALAELVKRYQDEGMAAAHIVPLLAGVLELVWWMPSWNGAVASPGSAAETFQARVQHVVGHLGVGIEELRAWRPAGQALAKEVIDYEAH